MCFVISYRGSVPILLVEKPDLKKAKSVTTFDLTTYSEALLRLHNHICPRQILGVRMGLYGASLLNIAVPQVDKRLMAFVELNGCFADGVAVATGCTLGHRTLYLMDYGKTAVTLVDSETNAAVRLAPRSDSRYRASMMCPHAQSKWHAYLDAYQQLGEADLFTVQTVTLSFDLTKLISKAGHRVTCEECGEEIINEREVRKNGRLLCRACVGDTYYVADKVSQVAWSR
jgi:formylmethanofuran dehydrogenase subunit E